MSKHDTYIAFDPSFVTMGAARYIPATGQLQMFTGDFDSVIDWVTKFDLSTTIAVVENPAMNQNTFGAWSQIQKALKALPLKSLKRLQQFDSTDADFDKMASVARQMLKISRDAGENMGAGKYLVRKLEAVGIPVVQVAPSERDKAAKITRSVVDGKAKTKTIRLSVRTLKMATKTSQAQFEEITGFTGRSTEHARDAATLIYGKAMSWGRMKLKFQETRKQREEQIKALEKKTGRTTRRKK